MHPRKAKHRKPTVKTKRKQSIVTFKGKNMFSDV